MTDNNAYASEFLKKSTLMFFPVFLIMYELVVNLSNDMYIPASTYLVDYFHTNAYYIQLTFTSWFAGSMIVNPILGVLSDNLCRKKILLFSGLCFMAASLYCAVSADIYLFLLARFIQGVTVTTIVICGYALVHDIYDDKRAIILISWMSGVLITAPMLGPLMGGYVIYFLNWQAIFVILAFVAAVSLVGIKFVMPERQVISQEPINWGQELLTYVKILCHTEFMLLTMISAMLFGGIIAWITASPFLLIGKYDFTPVQFGLAQMPIFGSYIVGTFVLKFFLKLDIKETRIITIGIVVAALTSALMFLTRQTGISNVTHLLALVSLYSFVFGLISSPLNRVAVKAVDYGLGKTMAMFDFMIGLSATVATILINVSAGDVLSLFYVTIGSFALLSCVFFTFNEVRSNVRKCR
nr:Major Facilitator Superfamily [uncultured bacterium]